VADNKIYTIEDIKQAASEGRCPEILYSLDSIYRTSILTNFVFERLEHKNQFIRNVYNFNGMNWNQTLYIMLMRTIMGFDNREVSMELSQRVTLNMIVRESRVQQYLEALLLGASGLLELYSSTDPYIKRLKDEFEHFAYKYDIKPMKASDWRTTKIYPQNHPTLRLVQLAACMYNNNVTIQRIVECMSKQDVYDMFSGEISEYWVTNFIPRRQNASAARRIGKLKSDLMGINFVAQIMFAYGNFIGSDSLISRALNLLEDIPAEDNRYVRRWNVYGPITKSSLDSQALIELTREYCIPGRCEECHLARYLIHRQDK
jgi:hypothetical protein